MCLINLDSLKKMSSNEMLEIILECNSVLKCPVSKIWFIVSISGLGCIRNSRLLVMSTAITCYKWLTHDSTVGPYMGLF